MKHIQTTPLVSEAPAEKNEKSTTTNTIKTGSKMQKKNGVNGSPKENKHKKKKA